MRMWLINPRLMCRKHLLGEHVELHMLLGSIKRNKTLDGFIKNRLIQTNKIQERHNELVQEIEHRGYKHNSPLEYSDKLNLGAVDPEESLRELCNRCPDCKQRQVC